MNWWEIGLLLVIFFVCFYGGGILFVWFGGISVARALEELLLVIFTNRKELD